MAMVEEQRDEMMRLWENGTYVWNTRPMFDALISAVEARGVEKGKAEGEERLQKYTEAYLAEGIRRCSAALAQGRVEGTEQERERIRSASQMVGVDSESVNFIGGIDNYIGAAFLVPVDVIDPPVLAPTKEKP